MRNLTRIFLALVVIAALTPPTGVQAQPFLHVENHYYTGCLNPVEVGSEAFGCDPFSCGTLSGDWKEEIVTRCSDGSEVRHRYFTWCGTSWVEVMQIGGGCIC